MRADEIVAGFNGATERKFWRASVAGGRLNPEVHFNSRSTMVRVIYNVQADTFSVSFSKTSVAFGDFLASVYRSMEQVLAALKAAGLPFRHVIDETSAVLRIEYDPRTKAVVVHVASMGDTWLEVEPAPFKVPERKDEKSTFEGLTL
jgi:hypothetical protein